MRMAIESPRLEASIGASIEMYTLTRFYPRPGTTYLIRVPGNKPFKAPCFKVNRSQFKVDYACMHQMKLPTYVN